MRQRFDQNVKQAYLCQEWRHVIPYDGNQSESHNSAVTWSRTDGRAGLKINEVEKAMQPHRHHIPQKRNNQLLPPHPCMTYITKRRTKAGNKGRVAEPAKNYSSDYKKDQKVLGVEGKIAKILYHGEARSN